MTTASAHKIEKQYSNALIGGLGGRTRRECWSATIDDTWKAERIDDVGTPWTLTHLPTGTVLMYCYDSQTVSRHCAETWGSLAKIIRYAIDGGGAERILNIMGAQSAAA